MEAKLDSHFRPYLRCFETATRSVAESAKAYLRGLYQSVRANLERMADVVAGSHYQGLHHMLSQSRGDCAGVRRQLLADANRHFGPGGTALVVNESGFAKKGEHSAGVARQWNGRLGKTDTCQVGVFAAIARREVAALVDAELYLPEGWTDDPDRCAEAGIPDADRGFRTKGEIALAMILRARRAGLQFDWVAFDAGYGHRPCLLNELDDERIPFLAEVRSDQGIYLADPAPAVPEYSGRGKRPPSRSAPRRRRRSPTGRWRSRPNPGAG